MKIQFAVYNIKWMKYLFHHDGSPKTLANSTGDDIKDAERSQQVAEIVEAMAPDILCIVEGPDTTAAGTKSSVEQLEAWRDAVGLDSSFRAVHGFTSGGSQELCALYRSDKLHLKHAPERAQSRNPFDEAFLVDTVENLIKEYYKHYRPPFEISVCDAADHNKELARVILAHAKSKGIFNSVDYARFEQLSKRNRKKLFAECLSIRERCDQWLKEDPELKLIVCGDINDGFGLDHFERKLRRSAVDILLGDVWEPEKILRHVLKRPDLNKWGWTPSSSRYRDRITDDYFNVLIDHILISQSVQFDNALVWNPYPRNAPDPVKQLKSQLTNASDHFPLSAVLTL